METFKIGDEFIHYTKRGGVNRGKVADIHLVLAWDLVNLCCYYKYTILTTNGVRLELDGSDGKIYKIAQNISQERATSLNNRLEMVKVKKHRPDKKLIHKVDED